MKRILLYMLLVIPMAVIAQTQTGEDVETTDQPRQQTAVEDNDTDKSEKSQESPGEAETSDSDFKPTEEISEDFPVLLPSDI